MDAVGFLLGCLMQSDGEKSAAKSERQLARGFFADIEVLVEPSARWAEDASFTPVKFDYFLAAAGGVGLGAAFLRPQQSISLRFENRDHRAAAMIVRFMVESRGPIGHVSDQSVLRRLELNHAHFGSFDVKVVSDFDFFGIGNEVGLPDRLQTDGIEILAACEKIIFAVESMGKVEREIKDEFRIAVKIHRNRCGGYSHQPYRLSAAVNQPMPAVQRRRKEAERPPFEQPLLPSLLPYFSRAVARENANHLLIEMPLRVERSARRYFRHVHAGLSLHAVEMDESSVAAEASPRTQLQVTDILDAKAFDNGNTLALHPLAIAGAF